MEMLSSIEINASGKTKEEVKEEIMKKVEKEVETILKMKEKKGNEEVKEGKRELEKFHIICDESEDGTGFGVKIENNGSGDHLFSMLVCMTASALNSLNDEDNQGNPLSLLHFIDCLMKEYTNSSCEGMVKVDGKEE